jgi:hypothetical protein
VETAFVLTYVDSFWFRYTCIREASLRCENS